MPAHRKDELEQRLIDHEVRLTEAREAGETYIAGRESRMERHGSRADQRWYRGELIAMLQAADTEAELRGLGLSDAVVREARLGNSVMDAWTRFRSGRLPLPAPPSGREARTAPDPR